MQEILKAKTVVKKDSMQSIYIVNVH